MVEKIYNAAKLFAALEALADRGIETDHVFEGTGLDPGHLEDGALRLSTEQILRAYKNISDKLWHPHLPYEIGSKLHISAYGMYGYAVLCSTNYRETVEFARRYHHLAAPTSSMAFCFDPGATGWSMEPKISVYDDRNFYAFLVNLQIGIFNSLHRDVLGPAFQSDRVETRYQPGGPYALPHEAAHEICYAQPCNRFLVTDDLLDKRLELGNQLTFKQLVQICNSELSELSQQDGVTGQIKRILLQNAAFSAGMEDIAEHLNMTSRTLRRHLKREETTFSGVVDSVRTELALKYLREASLSTEEIAHVLEFSEMASFVRAFKRWTGRTPKSYRNILQ